jgi:hypothetical protein
MRPTLDKLTIKATTAAAVATSLAAVLGGVRLGNHNETVVRERVG